LHLRDFEDVDARHKAGHHEKGTVMPSRDESKQFVPSHRVLTVSDTRSLEDDKSGTTLSERLTAAGHTLAAREIRRRRGRGDPPHHQKMVSPIPASTPSSPPAATGFTVAT